MNKGSVSRIINTVRVAQFAARVPHLMPSSVRIYQRPARRDPIIVLVVSGPTTKTKAKTWRRPVCVNVVIHFQLIRTLYVFGPEPAVVNQAQVEVEVTSRQVHYRKTKTKV